VAQGSEPDLDRRKTTVNTRIGVSDVQSESPPEEAGRLSNPSQRRLSPTDIEDLIEAYQAGFTITELAVRFRIHRTTVASHLDHHHIPRHRQRTAWDEETIRRAAKLYGTGLSLADVAAEYGIDAQTVANRFRRAGIPVRPRRRWPAQHQA